MSSAPEVMSEPEFRRAPRYVSASGVTFRVVAKRAVKTEGTEQVERDEQRAPGERDWPQPWMRPFLQALSTIPDVTAAARVAAVGRKTVYRYRESNPDFAEGWDHALEIARDGIQRIAWQWATTGVPVRSQRTTTRTKRDSDGNVVDETTEEVISQSAERSATLMIFWLKAWYPDRYRWVERVGVGGDPDSAPVQLQSLSEIDREIEKLAAELAQRANGASVPVEE